MPKPPFDPAFLVRARQILRDDSVNTAIAAKPQKPTFAGLWPKDKAKRMLVEALVQWALQPSQEHANAAFGCLTVFGQKHDERAHQELIAELTQLIEQHEGLMWNQMIFLALNFSKPTWRSSAALSLCVIYPADKSTLMAGPRFVAELAIDKRLAAEQQAALLAGALQLGDARTMSFLLSAWKQMSAEARYAASMIQPGTAQVPYIEFLLDALAWEPGGDIYGALAGQLGRLASFGGNDSPFVAIERAFPCWEGKDGPLLKREVSTRQQVAEKIHGRLIALKNAERGDRVMPMVLEVWQIDEPSADETEEADGAHDSGPAREQTFGDIAGIVFALFYNEQRSAQDRLKDSLIGGLLFGIREAGGQGGAARILARGGPDNGAFSAQVAATATLIAMVVDSPQFKQLYPPGGDLKHAPQSFAQVLHKLITDECPKSRLREGGTELCQEAVSRALMLAFVLWRDRPELARKVDEGLSTQSS